jgi:RNA-binding protein NOB1
VKPQTLARPMEAWPPLAPAPASGDAAPAPPAAGAWAATASVQRKVAAEESAAQAVSRLVASCANSSGVAVAVVDANAVISGAGALSTTAGRLVTVPEVHEEVRDAAARRRLQLLPTLVETVDPAPEFVKKGSSLQCLESELNLYFVSELKVVCMLTMLRFELMGNLPI